jgi:hypothetical protein
MIGHARGQPRRNAHTERSAIESLVFTLKESFEFGEMVRRTRENVLAEMLEKVEAYSISQIIRVRKGSGAIPHKCMFLPTNGFLGFMPPGRRTKAREQSLFFRSAV